MLNYGVLAFVRLFVNKRHSRFHTSSWQLKIKVGLTSHWSKDCQLLVGSHKESMLGDDFISMTSTLTEKIRGFPQAFPKIKTKLINVSNVSIGDSPLRSVPPLLCCWQVKLDCPSQRLIAKWALSYSLAMQTHQVKMSWWMAKSHPRRSIGAYSGI